MGVGPGINLSLLRRWERIVTTFRQMNHLTYLNLAGASHVPHSPREPSGGCRGLEIRKTRIRSVALIFDGYLGQG